MKDITDADISKAMAEFGEEVKAQAAGRKEFVKNKLQSEIERLRPHADRLIHGKDHHD